MPRTPPPPPSLLSWRVASSPAPYVSLPPKRLGFAGVVGFPPTRASRRALVSRMSLLSFLRRLDSCPASGPARGVEAGEAGEGEAGEGAAGVASAEGAAGLEDSPNERRRAFFAASAASASAANSSGVFAYTY